MGGCLGALERGKEIERKRRIQDLEDFMKKLSDGPDLRVNKNIVMFTSLASSDNLTEHYKKRKMVAGDCAADWIKNLAQKLGVLTPAPALAGLGALAIAVLIDICSLSPPEEDTKEALRSVFAEEKASEVWDQIDECLKRCMMYINNSDELMGDIKRIERRLSTALTKLKNSMVRDGHMSSEALKAWVNGAAFHVQMLIHLVRLGGIQTCDPVERLIPIYESDLYLLFSKHKEAIKGKCRFRIKILGPYSYIPYLMDEYSKKHMINGSYEDHFEAYYYRRYSRQKQEILKYFIDVRQKLQDLAQQIGSFNVNFDEKSEEVHHVVRSVRQLSSD